MDVENHDDIDHSMDVENPMNVEIIPLAEVVGIEVRGEVLVEERPKPQTLTQLSFYEKISYYVSMSTAILLMLSILGGLIMLMVWFCNPRILGDTNE
jgi:hypothetical protein